MDLALSIVLIAAFSGIILLAIMEAWYTHHSMAGFSQDIIDETVFYFKTNPAIICKIIAIHREGYSKPNVTLEVTYPDKSVSELITTLAEFQNLWEKEEDCIFRD